jgi:uncharacterized protein (DUF433 family)
MNTYKHIIERNFEIMNGKPLIKGTRITVELVLKKLSEGVSIDDFLKNYPHIKLEQIFAALEYASNVIGNEEILEVS